MKLKSNSMVRTAALVAAFTLTTALPCVAATPSATPTDLGVLPGCDESSATAINASGQILGNCGSSEGPDLPCIWQPGATTPTALPLLDGSNEGLAYGLNDSGVAAGGCMMTNTGDYLACRWQFTNNEWTVTELGVPEGYTGSGADAINEAGQILVEVWAEGTNGGAVWDNGSYNVMMYDGIPIMPFYFGPHIFNENGQALGMTEDWSLVLWDNSTSSATLIVTNLYTASLNDLGQVVGVYGDWANGDSDFVYDPNYGLGTVPVSTNGLYFLDINDNGQVLAQSADFIGPTDIVLINPDSSEIPLGSVSGYLDYMMLNGNGEVAGNLVGSNDVEIVFYASTNAGVVLLNSLVENGNARAYAINDSGLIVGSAYTTTTNETEHAVVWGEVAPPSSALTISDVTVRSPSSHSPNITVTVQISNPSDTDTAYDVTVTAATLDGVDTKSALPLVYGAIKPDKSKKCTLQFKSPDSGEQTLTVYGTSSLGDFSTTQTVTVP